MISILLAALLYIGIGVCLLGLLIRGEITQYVEATENRTQRTFVVEYYSNMMNRGSAKLYKRFGAFIIPCDTEKYTGEFLLDREYIKLNEDEKSIYISFFFHEPSFTVTN